MQIIHQQRIVEDAWQYLGDDEQIPSSGDVVVSLGRWKTQKNQLSERGGRLGVTVGPDDALEELAKELAGLDLIVLEFPRYNDGRSFSKARLLRSRYGYEGELRARGEVMRDHLDLMNRCGIDSMELRAGEDLEAALSAFGEIGGSYQRAG